MPSLKYAKIKSEPVLLFDNKSNDLHPTTELLTIKEVAGWLKISSSGLRRLQQARQIPFIKIGGSIRFLKDDIFAYLKNQRVDQVE
jgi:excisionase family DNA binding protein